jgi:hypothetical protein
VILITGEEAITKNSSLDGVQTRAFEVYGKPIDDIEFAKEVHIVSENNYGFAGTVFMRAICAVLRERPDYLRQKFLYFAEFLRECGYKNIHADYVAAVVLGDYLAETIIFGTDKETAECEALKCGAAIYALNAEQLTENAVERAWDFVQGWLVSNEFRFNQEATPYYGKIVESDNGQSTDFYVIPQYLDKALEDAGFNVKKSFQGFREHKKIITYTDGEGRIRTKTRARIGNSLLCTYRFRLKRDGTQPLTNNNNQP